MKDISRFDPSKAAVVLIDLQRGYCDPSSDGATLLNWDVSDADRVCHDHISFLKEVRKYLLPEKIIWLRMEEAKATYADNTSYGPHRLGDFVELCVRGTVGHDYHIIQPAPNEPQFLKFHASGFSNREFRTYLEKNSISQLVFTGVVLSRCVNATVITASSLGYECISLEDLVSGPSNHKKEMDEHEKLTSFFYAYAMKSGDFIASLRKAHQALV